MLSKKRSAVFSGVKKGVKRGKYRTAAAIFFEGESSPGTQDWLRSKVTFDFLADKFFYRLLSTY
jgi:hypothetical protein